MKKILDFLTVDIWRLRIRTLPRSQSLWVRPLRISLLAFRGFAEDKCQLRASALTFYSLLSVVPVLAMAFGIAKGFGFESLLESVIRANLQGQEEVVNWLIDFSNAFLANTKGGVIAGFGIALLFWAVIKVLGNIEKSFNAIWGIMEDRPFSRKLTDYLSIMLICPILFILSSSVTVFLTSQIQMIAEKLALLGPVSKLILLSIHVVPYLALWFLFTFTYMFMPNTKVSFRAAFFGGIIAGTLYQFVQWGYIHFQVGVAKYNAIYGSFAALPLFLIWLQISWLVVLLGAEISFALENEETYEFEQDCSSASKRLKKLLSLRIMELCAKTFDCGEPALGTHDFSQSMGVPIRLIREVLHELVQAGLLTELKEEKGREEKFQPALSLEKITLVNVLSRLDAYGSDFPKLVEEANIDGLGEKLEALEQRMLSAPENLALHQI
ncbi:MAG: YihY/virulence factor BrkB family protein [Candidatus Omnitrophica bacterium]|nr:YihY/virulence factor BrkB family protein [Candidatus Omnitrophota bacterium]